MGWLAALRQAALTRAMKRSAARRHEVVVDGLSLVVAAGVCDPAPALGVSFAPLFGAALRGLAPGEAALDVGTGCGVWALMAARAGAEVTATDLPHVPVGPVVESARRAGLPAPRQVRGDLFAPLAGARFDRVLFNPPFHFGEPRDDAERAYLGGAHGEVVRRFLAALPEHLRPSGRGYLILPRAERARYGRDLSAFAVEVPARRWLPVLGRVELLALRP